MSFLRAGTPITKVMIVLAGARYMAGARYDSLQDIIGTNPRTIYKLRDKFVDAVLACPELRIQYPTDLGIVMEGFTAKSRDGIFNKCIGCIDSFFQATIAPSKKEVNNNQLAYYSGHYESYGLNCQAVCHRKLRFIYFGVVGPGSMNVAVAFRKTGLQEVLDRLPEGCNMLGDAAYAISYKLLVPYTGSQRADLYRDSFNCHLSQLRIRVKMSFGRLVQKWRILDDHLQLLVHNNMKILRVCAALHNFVINYSDDNEDEPVDESSFIQVLLIAL